MALGNPVSILHLQGRYLPGESAEQWRGEGVCERMPLEGLLDRLPHYTVTSMVASKRIELEKGNAVHELQEGVSDVSSFLAGLWLDVHVGLVFIECSRRIGPCITTCMP